MLLIGATWPFGGSHTRAPIGLYTEVPEWSSGVLRTKEVATRTERLLGSEPAGVPRRQQHISRRGRREGTMWEWDGRSSVEKGRETWKQCERAVKESRSRSHRRFTKLLLWQAGSDGPRSCWEKETLPGWVTANTQTEGFEPLVLEFWSQGRKIPPRPMRSDNFVSLACSSVYGHINRNTLCPLTFMPSVSTSASPPPTPRPPPPPPSPSSPSPCQLGRKYWSSSELRDCKVNSDASASER